MRVHAVDPASTPAAVAGVCIGEGFLRRQADGIRLPLAARPAILNGIEDVVCRSDPADRAIFLALEPIADERRRTER